MTGCSSTMRRLRSAARSSHAAVVLHLCTTSSVNTYVQGADLYTVAVLYRKARAKETHGDTGRECQGYEVSCTHLPPRRCSSAQAPVQGSGGTDIGSGAASKAGACAWTRWLAAQHGGSKEIALPRASWRVDKTRRADAATPIRKSRTAVRGCVAAMRGPMGNIASARVMQRIHGTSSVGVRAPSHRSAVSSPNDGAYPQHRPQPFLREHACLRCAVPSLIGWCQAPRGSAVAISS